MFLGYCRCWQRDPRLRPDFSDILPVLREMHEALRYASWQSSVRVTRTIVMLADGLLRDSSC